MSAGLRTRHALVVVTVIALFTGCNSSEPPAPVARPVVPGIQLPVFEKSCAPQPGPSSVVPIRVVGRAAIVANVCIGGEGPFPFLVDTGATTTLVDSSLAARLHLALVDGPRTVSSFTCKRQVAFAAVSRWSVGNMTLLPRGEALFGTVNLTAGPTTRQHATTCPDGHVERRRRSVSDYRFIDHHLREIVKECCRGRTWAKRNLGFVLVATVGGPLWSLRQTKVTAFASAARRNSAKSAPDSHHEHFMNEGGPPRLHRD